MLRVNIGQVLTFVTYIYTSTIPISMASLVTRNETSLNDNTFLSGSGSGAINKNSFVACPPSCICTWKNTGLLNTTRCTEMFDGTYGGLNIENFILETPENSLAEPYEFQAHGLDHVRSIAITNRPHTFNPTEPDESQLCISATLDYNGKLNIHPDVFRNNSELDRLIIYQFESLMDNCNRTKNYLFDAQTLTKLIFSVSDYKCWSSSSFSRMSNLRYLFLQSPNFTMIPGIFMPLRNLVELEMRRISHLNIPQNSFDGVNLRKLTLAHNVVESFTEIRAAALEFLHLEHNSIKYISQNDFIGFPALQSLIISDRIKTIHEDAFTHLGQLKYLKIENSDINSLTTNHLRDNFQLKVLIMTNNHRLENLPVFKLSNPSKSYNISEFKCSDCRLRIIQEGTFDAMPKLEQLNLYKNGLEKLPRGLLKPLLSLEFLDLSKNLISNIPDDMFEGAVELVQLNLAENPLTTLKMSPFLRTPKLAILDLSNCQIKAWSTIPTPINSLEFLSLYGNQLKRITTDHLATMPNLKELKTLDNPIQCDNELQYIVSWATMKRIRTQFAVSLSSFCVPDEGRKTCWQEFQKVICSSNYISESEHIRQDTRNDSRQYASMYDDDDETFVDTNATTIAPLDTPSKQAPRAQIPTYTSDNTFNRVLSNGTPELAPRGPAYTNGVTLNNESLNNIPQLSSSEQTLTYINDNTIKNTSTNYTPEEAFSEQSQTNIHNISMDNESSKNMSQPKTHNRSVTRTISGFVIIVTFIVTNVIT